MPRKSKAQFVRWMPLVLDALRDLGGSGEAREVSAHIAEMISLPEEKRLETIRTGAPKFHNQVMWARLYLSREGYLDSSKRGVWVLTEKGKNKKLSEDEATDIYKRQSAESRKSAERRTAPTRTTDDEDESVEPEETGDLLEVIQSLSPSGFEHVCMLLLRESGFTNVKVTGRPHDEGIDGLGTLELNSFVSFKVLFQCKRYKGTVSRSQVGDFRNAVMGRAEKGIIITTGSFSSDAVREANRDGVIPVELVDGRKLVRMFESLELGVKPKTVYDVDYGFFEKFR